VSKAETKPASQHGLRSVAFERLMRDFVSCPGHKKLMLVAS